MRIFFISILIFFSCHNQSDLAELNGIWCNQTNHCIYFNKGKCIIDKAEINDFKILSDNEIKLIHEEKPSKYQIKINNDILSLKTSTNASFREFKKYESKNNIEIKELFFSQISEFSDFEMHLNHHRKLSLRINYHEKFESGDYVVELPETLFQFIQELINGMDIKIPPKLKKGITSDIQEWGLKLVADEDYFIYYNYEQVNKFHHNLAWILERTPYFVDLKNGKILIDLQEINTYLKNEFERNINEQTQ